MATMGGTSLRSRTIPSSVSKVKLKSQAPSQDQVGTWINLQQTFRVIQARIDERLRAETDLSWPEFELLMRLELAADPLQMSEIAAQLVGSPGGTRGIAERLRAETALSWPEFELLMRLELAADPLQMSEIAAQLVGSPSGTTRIADRLEKDGLIVRATPRENRRIVRVQLTEH